MKTRIQLLPLLALLAISGLILGACAGATPAAPAEPADASAVVSPTTAPSATTPATHEPTAEPTAEPQPTAIVLVDGLGREFTVEEPYQRVISIAPSNTEILFAIGAGEQVVGRDSFSDYPAAALEVTDIGGGWGELDTETIVSLDPDLVLASELTPAEQVQALENLGLTVFYLANPVELEGLYANLLTVADLTGHREETETLVAGLRARVAVVTEKTASIGDPPVVFYELDGTDPNAPWTSGAGTFIDTLLSMAGGENLGNILDGAWTQINLEALVAEDPDIILLGDALWGGVTPEIVAARAGWEALSAVQADRVYPFDDNLVSRPGPRLVDGLEELARLLHPELFE